MKVFNIPYSLKYCFFFFKLANLGKHIVWTGMDKVNKSTISREQ